MSVSQQVYMMAAVVLSHLLCALGALVIGWRMGRGLNPIPTPTPKAKEPKAPKPPRPQESV